MPECTPPLPRRFAHCLALPSAEPTATPHCVAQGMFCCNFMKRCVPSSSTPCYYAPKGWATCSGGTCSNSAYPNDWVECGPPGK